MIARNILNLRKAANLTQEQIAERIGVARQTIAKWENGDSVPDIDSCSRIAYIFNVSLDDLVNYSGGETPAGPLPPKGKYVFGAVTVGERGQIVIPSRARRIFDIQAGDTLVMLGDINQGLAMVKEDGLLEMLGYSKKPGDPEQSGERGGRL